MTKRRPAGAGVIPRCGSDAQCRADGVAPRTLDADGRAGGDALAFGSRPVGQPEVQRLDRDADGLHELGRAALEQQRIADGEDVLLLFEPDRYPVAYFPESVISPDTLQRTEHTTRHPDLGLTSWYTVRAGEQSAPRGAWRHIDLPAYASELQARVAFAWPAMDAFYEEDERIMGHAADSYHRYHVNLLQRLAEIEGEAVWADTGARWKGYLSSGC